MRKYSQENMCSHKIQKECIQLYKMKLLEQLKVQENRVSFVFRCGQYTISLLIEQREI